MVFVKHSGGKVDFTIDWAETLGSDEIATSSWQVNGGASVVSSSRTTTKTTVVISGGTFGGTVVATNTINTTASPSKTHIGEISVRIL